MRKYLESIFEILESERNYLNDLIIWSQTFKMLILRSPELDQNIKSMFTEKVLGNIQDIFELHKEIISGLIDKNREFVDIEGVSNLSDDEIIKFENVEYHTVYLNSIKKLGVYETYIKNLPYCHYTMKKILQNSKVFKDLMEKFFKDSGFSGLGYIHFADRPSQKLFRYSLLFSAMYKRCKNEEYKIDIKRLIDIMDRLSARMNIIYGNSKNQFSIYELSKNFKIGRYILPVGLDLLPEKRVLIMQGDVIFQSDVISEPFVKRVIIFDHLIVVCDVVATDKTESLFIEQVFAPFKYNITTECKEENNVLLQKYHKIYIIEKNTDKIIKFFFQNAFTRDSWLESLRKSYFMCTENYDKGIKIVKMDKLCDESIVMVCGRMKFFDPKKLTNCDYMDQDELRENGEKIFENIQIQEAEFLTENKKPHSFIDKFVFGGDFFSRRIYLKHKKCTNYGLRIFNTKSGIFKRINHTNYKIYPNNVEKMTYISDLGILVFQEGTNTMVAEFTPETNEIKAIFLDSASMDFFFCPSGLRKYIAVIKNRSGSFGTIFLYSIQENTKGVEIFIYRRLYIGTDVNDLKFLSGELAISGKSFDILNPNSLQIRDLINPLDPYLPYYFQFCPNYKALFVSKISRNCFIVCFDIFGFIIDMFGRSINSRVLFLWHCVPVDFKVVNQNLIVLGKFSTAVYCMKTGNLLFFDNTKSFKFVKDGGLLLHDENYIYKIVFPRKDKKLVIH